MALSWKESNNEDDALPKGKLGQLESEDRIEFFYGCGLGGHRQRHESGGRYLNGKFTSEICFISPHSNVVTMGLAFLPVMVQGARTDVSGVFFR